MKNRLFPRFDIRTVTRAEQGYAAFLIDHDTGDTWILDSDLSWKSIEKKTIHPDAKATSNHLKELASSPPKPKRTSRTKR